MQRTILITAFMPFGGDALNPTETVLNALPEEIDGFAVAKLLLPVEFGRAAALACAEYDRLSPTAVIMLGQAGGRAAITPEAVGRNVMNARIPDNAGRQPVNEPIVPGGAEELYSTLPLEGIVESIRAFGIPAEISRDAGAYVCNSLLYGMLAHNGGSVPTGFIHVPFIPEQGHGDKPSLPVDALIRGISAAIAETVKISS